jgi:hypothetical protein
MALTRSRAPNGNGDNRKRRSQNAGPLVSLFERMDITQLRGISKTAPYFQNNSAATLEEVLDHYDAFFANLAQLIPLPNLPALLSSNGLVVDRGFVTADERAALLSYLRKP